MKAFILGVVVTLAVLVLAGYVGITQGLLIPANADSPPSHFERWAASRSLHATIEREMPTQADPIAPSDANYLAGVRLYAANCSACHGVADGRPSTIAAGLYQRAPQLGRHGVEDDPEGETYWKIAHGIRLTGMPSFGKSLTDAQIWTLALLLKHLDALPPGPAKAWKSLKSPVALAPKQAP